MFDHITVRAWLHQCRCSQNYLFEMTFKKIHCSSYIDIKTFAFWIGGDLVKYKIDSNMKILNMFSDHIYVCTFTKDTRTTKNITTIHFWRLQHIPGANTFLPSSYILGGWRISQWSPLTRDGLLVPHGRFWGCIKNIAQGKKVVQRKKVPLPK